MDTNSFGGLLALLLAAKGKVRIETLTISLEGLLEVSFLVDPEHPVLFQNDSVVENKSSTSCEKT